MVEPLHAVGKRGGAPWWSPCMLWGPSSRLWGPSRWLHARTPRGACSGNPWQSVAISGAYPAGPAGVGSPWATAASESISSVISRIAQPPPIVTASSPSTRSPPMSVLIDASIGSVMPLPDRPSPWPGFHPIYEVRASTIRGHQRSSEVIRGNQRTFSRRASPRPESTGRSFSFERASLAALGTRAPDCRMPSLPTMTRRRPAAALTAS